MQRTSLLSTAATLAVLSVLVLITFPKAQAQAEPVLYSLCSVGFCYDGTQPIGSLVADQYGDLYGATQSGGTGACNFLFCGFGGAVFELSPEPAGGCSSGTNTGNGWCEQVLYSFCSAAGDYWPYCPDGLTPMANLMLVRTGTRYNPIYDIYGTTYNGGTGSSCQDPNGYGCGIAFELSPVPLPTGICPSGATKYNNWCQSVLYNFCSQANCADGSYPTSALVRDSAGNLFGVNSSGVYELSPNGSGGWTESVIYADYAIQGGLAMDAGGSLYGADPGNVFKVSWVLGFGGHFHWAATNIHTFPGSLGDGLYPVGTPAVDSAGDIYGTTNEGGSKNLGTLWKLIPVTTGTEAGTYKEKILHSFTSVTTGDYPGAGVTLDSSGNIYGTTEVGGKYVTQCTNSTTGNPIGCGTVFKLAASGTTYTYKLLWSFDNTDGEFPYDSPTLDSSGHLYGTTYEGGGPTNGGTVFELNPLGVATTSKVTSSSNPSTSGETVTFTATVSSSKGAPPDGETVNFMKGSILLGTGTLSGGSASFMTSSLPVGTSKIDAVYGGDLNFATSTSNTVSQVVKN